MFLNQSSLGPYEVGMSKRLKKNLPMLQTYQCSPKERADLLKVAKPDLIYAECGCNTNIAHDRIPILQQQKGILTK